MEKQVLKLISTNKINIPLSSLDSKLQTQKVICAKDIARRIGKVRFVGERSYAFVEQEYKDVPKGMKEALAKFSEDHPKYGEILENEIAKEKVQQEDHLYFGLHTDKRISHKDYMSVMRNIGLSEHRAHSLYPMLADISRSLTRKNDIQNSVIVGRYDLD